MSPVFHLMIDSTPLLLDILEYVHKDLYHLLSVTLSNIQCKKLNKEPLFFYCERGKARIVKEDTFPLSLLIRANLFKDGFELPPRVNCLKLISDLN